MTLHLRRLLVPLLAVALLGAPAAAQSRTSNDLVDDAIEAMWAGQEDAHRELVALGKSILPTVVARIDGLELGPESRVPEGPVIELLAKVLAALPEPEVHRALAPDDDLSDQARCARLGAISAFGLGSEVNLLIDLAGSCEERGQVSHAVQTCAERMHRRSSSCFRGIASVYMRAPMPLREALVRGVAAVARLDSVEVLGDFLDLVPELDPLILSSIGRIGSLDPLEVPDRVRAQVRRLLEQEPDDPRVREAALVAGRLEDALAMNTLVELLKSPSAGVRGNAHWSLRHVSKLPLDDDYFRWLTWLRGNEMWWADDWPAVRAALRGGVRSETCEAIREIAGRRYRRHELAQEVLYVLRRSDDDVTVAYACLALASLDSPVAHEPLIDLLDDSRERVRGHAHGALRAITELDLAPEIDLWREALATDDLES